VGGQSISPQEVQAYILESLRASAQRFLGHPVTRAVITVPAFFDEVQRQAVRDSALIAGFEYSKVLAEPTAAALAYGYAQYDNRRIVIVDFGGGTLDVTVMKVHGGKFEVLATDGDLLLGGHDFDNAIALAFAREIMQSHEVDVMTDPIAVQRLVAEAESSKRRLSQEQTVSIELPYLAKGPHGPIDFRRTLSRDQLEVLTRDQVERLVEPCRRALAQAGVRPSECDDVILVGGMSRSPAIQKRVAELFQRRPSLRVNPDEVVAIGASLLAGQEASRQISFVDALPRAIGIRGAGDRMIPLLAKSTPMPAKASKAFTTTMDSQRVLEVRVLQGEDPMASKNRELANIVIDRIPPAPAGAVKLKVTLGVDSEGGLTVEATVLNSNTQTRVDIQPAAGLARAQVQQLCIEHRKRRGEDDSRAAASGPTASAAEGGDGFAIDFSPRPTKPAPARAAAPTSTAAASGSSRAQPPRATSAGPAAAARGPSSTPTPRPPAPPSAPQSPPKTPDLATRPDATPSHKDAVPAVEVPRVARPRIRPAFLALCAVGVAAIAAVSAWLFLGT
jgi:molecular chaperone DnaK